MPRKPGGKAIKSEPTVVVAARIKKSVYEIIDVAADLRGVDRQQILIDGGTKEALRILKTSIVAIRRYRERQRRARAEAERQRRRRLAHAGGKA